MLTRTRLVFLVGSVCVFLLVVGGLVLSGSLDFTALPNGDGGVTDYPSGTMKEDPKDGVIVSGGDTNTGDGSEVVTVELNFDCVSVSDEQFVVVDQTTVIVRSGGTYSISGTLYDGQIIVDTYDKKEVELVLNGVSISSASSAPIHVVRAAKVVIVLADNKQNILTDSSNNRYEAALFSKSDLEICGNGSLAVCGNTNDAIRIDRGLTIKDGTVAVTAVDDGIYSKDYLTIRGGCVTVDCFGDGLKSENSENADAGIISIEDGTINVNSTSGDAITAQTNITVSGGTFTLTSGGGRTATLDDLVSAKGLKAGFGVVVDGGNFTIDSRDDAVHSDNLVAINNGTFHIVSGDDGIHADRAVEINGGTVDIARCYEGIEGTKITINGGHVTVVSNDDGINIPEASTTSPDLNDSCVYINGGFVYIDSVGDSIDTGRYIEISGGLVILDGPAIYFNTAIDFRNGTFKITGGTLVAVESIGLIQAPSNTSTQHYMLVKLNAKQPNQLVNLQKASGETVFTFKPKKTYQAVIFSSPELTTGDYTLYFGGSCTGTSPYGLYEDGVYTAGTEYVNFTVNSAITEVDTR